MPRWLVSQPDRLDTFLSQEGRMLSRNRAQTAIDEGRVSVNDLIVRKAAHRLQEGDVVDVVEEEHHEEVAGVEPVDLKLTLLYEDDRCAVTDKPAGVAVHPGAGMLPGEPTILHGVAHLYKKWRLPFSGSSVLVHRLDKDTTGCLLIAKDPEAHLMLQKQFETRTVEKTYLALTPVPSPRHATIDAPVGRSANERTKMAVLGAQATREAQTTYRTLAQSTAGDVALLSCELHTGRTHQIRVHLSSIGYPVLGDGTYRNELSERLGQQYDIRHLCLHAWKLSFDSPAGGTRIAVQSPLPVLFGETMKRVGLKWVG